MLKKNLALFYLNFFDKKISRLRLLNINNNIISEKNIYKPLLKYRSWNGQGLRIKIRLTTSFFWCHKISSANLILYILKHTTAMPKRCWKYEMWKSYQVFCTVAVLTFDCLVLATEGVGGGRGYQCCNRIRINQDLAILIGWTRSGNTYRRDQIRIWQYL